MNMHALYQQKLVSAEKAVSIINSGDWVDYGHFITAPVYLDEALSKRKEELQDVKIRASTFPGLAKVATVDPERRHFLYNCSHMSGGDRKLHDQGLCNYITMFYHDVHMAYANYLDVDVFVVRCSPMDAHGFFNIGMGNSIASTIWRKAKKIILEVNTNVPVCLGGFDESIHISQVTHVVESDNAPLLAIPAPAIAREDEKIAELVVSRLKDGSCLQLGIGGMPNAIGKMIAQSDLKNLGVHTEMLADSYVDMYEAGRITNMNKKICRGKMAYTFSMGSQKLYDFLHYNPVCASYPADYINDLSRIAANARAVSINNAVEVDLFGQVSSESTGVRHISGTGGQFDYHYGCYHSEEGQSFICLRSTKEEKDGTLKSRIVPVFEAGTIVTLPRAATHLVVTEYGVVNLKGLSTWERVEAMVSIAHPDFREELMQAAVKMNIWKRKFQPAGDFS